MSDVKAMLERLDDARERVVNHIFKKGDDRALMSIPVNVKRDVDIVLTDAADMLEEMAVEIELLQADSAYAWARVKKAEDVVLDATKRIDELDRKAGGFLKVTAEAECENAELRQGIARCVEFLKRGMDTEMVMAHMSVLLDEKEADQ